MKNFITQIILSSAVFTVPSLSNAGNIINNSPWVGTWEQTRLYNKSANSECKINQFLKFQYIIKKSTDAGLEGVMIQTDYRFNLTSPPNPDCKFTNTKSANVLFNVKKWHTKITYNEKNKTLRIKGHSGECLHDLCKSPSENDFETTVSLGNGYIIDDFGTSNTTDDIKLLRSEKRDLLFAEAKKVVMQAEKHIKQKNCTGLYNMMKKSPRKKLAADYVATCDKSNQSKPSVDTLLNVDQFLSFDTNGNHWVIFVNKVNYQDKTEKHELMYLVHEDNTWKFWGIYPQSN